MTKKSFNQLLRYDPNLGKSVDGKVFAEHQPNLRPLVIGRASQSHIVKMAAKRLERDGLAMVFNQSPQARQRLQFWHEHWAAINRTHGVGSPKVRGRVRAQAAIEQFGVAA